MSIKSINWLVLLVAAVSIVFNAYFLFSVKQVEEISVSETVTAMDAIAVGAETYHASQGSYPKSISDLAAGGYISSSLKTDNLYLYRAGEHLFVFPKRTYVFSSLQGRGGGGYRDVPENCVLVLVDDKIYYVDNTNAIREISP